MTEAEKSLALPRGEPLSREISALADESVAPTSTEIQSEFPGSVAPSALMMAGDDL